MQNKLNDILLEVLKIAHYPHDKEQFVKNFEAYNRLEAIMDVYDELPSETQAAIKECGEDSQKMMQYIPQETFLERYSQVTEVELKKILYTLKPTLNMQQQTQISQLFR